ncbi:MAG: murein transglycosylase [Alphaproteobacteria bacterium]|nr:murein transglycosylase [Alphaproteobacteria bacterium]
MPRFAPAIFLSFALGLAGCAGPKAPVPAPVPEAPPARLVLRPATFADLPGWTADRVAEALPALRRTCARLARLSDTQTIGNDALAGRVADWRAPCAAAERIGAQDARAFFEANFIPFALSNNDAADGLFTGYYEPELRGSLKRSARFSIPLYGRPDDLVTVDLGAFRDELRGQRIAGRVENGALRPYDTRQRITEGSLGQRGKPLLWVDDATEAFFLEVQGSGRVVLEDGRILRVGFAAQNGQPYVPIGRTLIERGALTREDVSLQSIKAWLLAHPAEAAAIRNSNPSYVFFRVLDGDGPLGSEGVALTPGRSLAVDRAFLPMGVPVFLDADDPLDPAQRLQRLVMAQDTGGAIRGPVRGDVFWGAGKAAEERAGRMRSTGRAWLLLPRAVAERRLRVS